MHESRLDTVGVEFVDEPRQEPYGQVAVFVDLAGNRWDLLGPRPGPPPAETEPGRETVDMGARTRPSRLA